MDAPDGFRQQVGYRQHGDFNFIRGLSQRHTVSHDKFLDVAAFQTIKCRWDEDWVGHGGINFNRTVAPQRSEPRRSRFAGGD